MKLELCMATMTTEAPIGYLDSLTNTASDPNLPVRLCFNSPEKNLGVVGSYNHMFEDSDADILCYFHDDVECREQGWDKRVEAEFEDPTVGVVGFGGAIAHGDPDLYKKPYELTQLARSGYLSNVDDAEFHGTRFTGATDVAVLDGFSLCIRRSLLEAAGGWHPELWPPHHIYDYAICAMAHRLGYRVRCLGIRCHHHGGRTVTTQPYLDWTATTEWGSDAAMHKEGHWLFYSRFRDVMPWVCDPPAELKEVELV